MKKLFLALITCLFVLNAFGDNDVMVTRDGSFLEIKVIKMNGSEITFINLKKKRLGELKAPTDFVYAILKEKGSNIFFDEEGNQTTSPAIKIDDKENYLFLNDGRIFPIYSLSIKKDELTYKLKDKKKAPYQNTPKDEVFLVKFSDGTATLINNNYLEKRKQQQAAQLQQQAAAHVGRSLPTATVTTTPTPTTNQNLLITNKANTTNTPKTTFSPAVDMQPQEIEMKINSINPYTLYRKGSVAEYAFEKGGKPERFMGGPTYVQQIVADAKIENGLLVAYIQQAFLNKKHKLMEGISKEAKEYLFPTEIDTAGVFHLTHDISRDYNLMIKRQGYAMLIPSNLKVGDELKCSTINDIFKSAFGGKLSGKAEYSNFKVVAEEPITTPAGTFNCLKLTGKVTETASSQSANYIYTWWIARGIGFVRYEILSDTKKGRDNAPMVIYLNKLDLK